jgi:hypothetical protein
MKQILCGEKLLKIFAQNLELQNSEGHSRTGRQEQALERQTNHREQEQGHPTRHAMVLRENCKLK